MVQNNNDRHYPLYRDKFIMNGHIDFKKKSAKSNISVTGHFPQIYRRL